jgi:hypothetical protein
MKRFHAKRTLAMLLFPLIAVETLSAAPADPRLLSLVPPGTQLAAVVAGKSGFLGLCRIKRFSRRGSA